MFSDDTIVAISSAAGAAARMIVRASGAGALDLAEAIAGLGGAEGNTVRRAVLRFAGLEVSGQLYVFRAPRSYTGEDLVEFHIPGNPLLARLLLAALVNVGARLAEPGEFTARAYFRGRIDLAEAEGVAATIAAGNDAELRAARQLLSGELARRLRPAMDAIAQTLALLEVGIDFSEEEITTLPEAELTARIASADALLEKLVGESDRFERLSHEPTFVLVGRPNAGKSTLLNALAGRERAVVSPVAGTTRDLLSAEVVLSRGTVRVLDAAGLEDTDHAQLRPEHATAAPQQINLQMQARARSAVEAADFVVLVRDVTDAAPAPDLPRPPDLSVVSKADLAPATLQPHPDQLFISAKCGLHMDRLRDAMGRLAFDRTHAGSGSLALTARHLAALDEARAALARAQDARGSGAELCALELREALQSLGSILGQMTPDDLLGRIFSSFCIGK